MRISAAFPSEYLKAADLQGRQIPVKIDRVELKDIGGEHKPILFFVGKDKGMVLNKTNANTISAAYGDDTEDWADGDVILFESMVDFQGKTVPAIRVKVPPRSRAERSVQAPARQPETAGAPIDDDIPF